MQESIWGTINLMVEIALNIYMVYAENGSGIVMPKEKASQFSEETVKQAVEEGDKLYFESGAPVDAVMRELLEQRLLMAKKVEAECTRFMQLYQEGKEIADILGTFPVPSGGQDFQEIRNGIYMPKEEENVYIHKALAKVFLSPYALEFGSKEGEYYCYSGNAIAIPFYELQAYFPECKDMIVQEESLIASLHANYPVYVERMNSVLPNKEQIITADATPNLFLQSQIDRLDLIETDEEQEELVFEEMEEFGEQIDYSFEL